MSRLLYQIRINSIRPRLIYHQQLRHFINSSTLYKDEKSKQMLKILGVSLQEGKIENNEEKEEEEETNQKQQNTKSQTQEEEEDFLDSTPQLPDYESISNMSNKEFLYQLALDGNRPFMSHENKNRIDSKKILKQIPDQINLQDTSDLSMTKINEIYENLKKLDSNKEMHEKYLKRYFYDYNNDLILLGQTIRGIQTKFKMLRRNEIDKFNPENVIYEYINDKMKLPYNVVGFDRSLIGLPIRENLDSKIYPREFIQDLPSYSNKINVKKFDLNFMEKDGSINIDPNRVTSLKELYDYENKNYNSDKGGIYSQPNNQVNKITHEYLSNKLGIPRNYIQIPNTEDYKRLKLNNHQITNRIEQEIRIMKNLLMKEIKTTIENSNAVLLSNKDEKITNDYIKSNSFILCEIKNTKQGTIYIWKSFNILPIYFLLPLNKRRERNLKNHLFKLFLLNLEDKIDILFKIKYDSKRDFQKFMKILTKNIGHTIKFRLWRYFKSIKSNLNNRSSLSSTSPIAKTSSLSSSPLSSSPTFSSSIQLPLLKQNFIKKDAIIYQPFKNQFFKRIYWIKKPNNNKVLRKTNLKVNYANINDELIE
ncbi:uncharacterized protein KGF55_002253 [Candida pseudojiufengensis]|uniref:uncharacterized protein n=1 Tax=Candida pseudojiufengensis TaxID=497109 RepID=UPI002224182B|nr:uncharacterized protein KGF55_002253 [Candida pseudojiufengensis]KAI5964311.1 hypothetical protein KGF55_002253 [Candida pseudojiufengensis]